MPKQDTNPYDRAIGVLQRLVKLYNYFRNPKNLGKAKKKADIKTGINMPESYSDKTLERDLKALESYFDVKIAYDQSKKYYYEATGKDIAPNRKELNDLFTLCLNLQDAQARLKTVLMTSNTILFEHDDTFLLQSDLFLSLQAAITNHHVITITHKGYEAQRSKKKKVEPVILRQHKKLWYLVAYDIEGKCYKNYGLDRISAIDTETEDKPYSNRATDHIDEVKKILALNYGSFMYDIKENKPTLFKLKLTGYSIPYTKASKIHSSQEIIKDDPNELILTVNLIDNTEFKNDLKSYGKNLEVLSPENYSLD